MAEGGLGVPRGRQAAWHCHRLFHLSSTEGQRVLSDAASLNHREGPPHHVPVQCCSPDLDRQPPPGTASPAHLATLDGVHPFSFCLLGQQTDDSISFCISVSILLAHLNFILVNIFFGLDLFKNLDDRVF